MNFRMRDNKKPWNIRTQFLAWSCAARRGDHSNACTLCRRSRPSVADRRPAGRAARRARRESASNRSQPHNRRVPQMSETTDRDVVPAAIDAPRAETAPVVATHAETVPEANSAPVAQSAVVDAPNPTSPSPKKIDSHTAVRRAWRRNRGLSVEFIVPGFAGVVLSRRTPCLNPPVPRPPPPSASPRLPRRHSPSPSPRHRLHRQHRPRRLPLCPATRY